MAITPTALWWVQSGDDLFSDFHRSVLGWVRGLGLDPNRVAPEIAVVQYGDRYELHVDEVVEDRINGGDRYDPLDFEKLLAIRRIIEVEKDSWPTRPDLPAKVDA